MRRLCRPESSNMKVLMAIADDNRIKFRIVMRNVPEIGFRFTHTREKQKQRKCASWSDALIHIVLLKHRAFRCIFIYTENSLDTTSIRVHI